MGERRTVNESTGGSALAHAGAWKIACLTFAGLATMAPPTVGVPAFAPGATLQAEAIGPLKDLIAVDVNNDRYLDLVVLGDRGIRIFINHDSAVWEELSVGINLPRVVAIAAADLDLDGSIDLAAMGEQELHLLRNGGRGDFTYFSLPLDMEGGVQRVLPADVNGDGRPELLGIGALDQLSPRAKNFAWIGSLHPGDSGDYRFAKIPLNGTGLDCCDAPVEFSLDTDADGAIDLIGISQEGDLVVNLNNGQGEFEPIVRRSLPGFPAAIAGAGDFDNDGRPDLVIRGIAAPDRDRVAVLRGVPGAAFETASPFAVPDGIFARHVAIIDADADGFLDLILIDVGGNGGSALLVNDSANRFVVAELKVPVTNASPQRRIAHGDFDRDGYEDFVVAEGDGRISIWRNMPWRNHWLGIDLAGFSNRGVTAATVFAIRKDGSRVSRQLQGGRSASLGLGVLTQVQVVTVKWPGGRTTNSEVRGVDRFMEITQPDAEKPKTGRRLIGKPITTAIGRRLECR
jgi:hypothetical protein